MGLAKTMKAADVKVAARGRKPEPLNSDLVSDLRKLAGGKVEAMDLGPYFPNLADGNKPRIGQAIRKHFVQGLNKENADSLRLDFVVAEGLIQARIRKTAEVVDTEATA